MTSRVEAVAKCLRERADDVFAWRDNAHGIDDQTWFQLAQAAIEANDAWLTKQGFMLLSPGWSNHWISPNAELPVGNVCNPPSSIELYQCDRCGTRNDLGDECRGCGEPSP